MALSYHHSSLTWDAVYHDDVIKWKYFPHYWPFFAGNSPVNDEFPTHRPVTQSFNVFFDLRLNKRLRKQSRGWWFETPSRSLWRHHNVIGNILRFLFCFVLMWSCYQVLAMQAIYWPIFFRVTSLALGQSHDCPVLVTEHRKYQGPILLMWINFNPSMYK